MLRADARSREATSLHSKLSSTEGNSEKAIQARPLCDLLVLAIEEKHDLVL